MHTLPLEGVEARRFKFHFGSSSFLSTFARVIRGKEGCSRNPEPGTELQTWLAFIAVTVTQPISKCDILENFTRPRKHSREQAYVLRIAVSQYLHGFGAD